MEHHLGSVAWACSVLFMVRITVFILAAGTTVSIQIIMVGDATIGWALSRGLLRSWLLRKTLFLHLVRLFSIVLHFFWIFLLNHRFWYKWF